MQGYESCHGWSTPGSLSMLGDISFHKHNADVRIISESHFTQSQPSGFCCVDWRKIKSSQETVVMHQHEDLCRADNLQIKKRWCWICCGDVFTSVSVSSPASVCHLDNHSTPPPAAAVTFCCRLQLNSRLEKKACEQQITGSDFQTIWEKIWAGT